MSVHSNQYIILGVKLPKTKGDDFYDKHEECIDTGYGKVKQKNGLTIIYDGMSGGYILAGRVIQRSDLDENLHGPIELKADPAAVEETKALLTSYFGIENPDVRLWFVTYYH